MSTPRTLDKHEAVEILAPLVWPMVRDLARIGTPIGGNAVTAGVDIYYNGVHTTLTTDQYELFRVEVVKWVSDRYYLSPYTHTLSTADLDRVVRQRVAEVFQDA